MGHVSRLGQSCEAFFSIENLSISAVAGVARLRAWRDVLSIPRILANPATEKCFIALRLVASSGSPA